MPKRQMGGLLVIGGVILTLVTSALAITGGTDPTATRSLGHLLMVAYLGLLGVGVSLISIDRAIFVGTLARRGLGILGFGLIGLSVITALLILPVFDGDGIILLYIPIIAIFIASIVGAGLTVLALVAAGGRPRIVGAIFLAAVAALAADLLINDLTQIDGLRPPAIVAGGALLLGFVGLALLAMGGLRHPPGPRQESERSASG